MQHLFGVKRLPRPKVSEIEIIEERAFEKQNIALFTFSKKQDGYRRLLESGGASIIVDHLHQSFSSSIASISFSDSFGESSAALPILNSKQVTLAIVESGHPLIRDISKICSNNAIKAVYTEYIAEHLLRRDCMDEYVIK